MKVTKTMKSRRRVGRRPKPCSRGLLLATPPRSGRAFSSATLSEPVSCSNIFPKFLSLSHQYPAQAQALVALIRKPIHFVPASKFTFEDEAKMAVLRPRRVVRSNETPAQRVRSIAVGKGLYSCTYLH